MKFLIGKTFELSSSTQNKIISKQEITFLYNIDYELMFISILNMDNFSVLM